MVLKERNDDILIVELLDKELSGPGVKKDGETVEDFCEEMGDLVNYKRTTLASLNNMLEACNIDKIYI